MSSFAVVVDLCRPLSRATTSQADVEGEMRNPGPFIFSPRLYLDDFSMVFLGWLYGLDKVRTLNNLLYGLGKAKDVNFFVL